jgi:hypothetical protein
VTKVPNFKTVHCCTKLAGFSAFPAGCSQRHPRPSFDDGKYKGFKSQKALRGHPTKAFSIQPRLKMRQ